MPVIPAMQEVEVKGLRSKSGPGQKCENLSENLTEPKRAGGMAQVVEHLPRECEALGLNSSTTVWGVDYEKPMRM
jgi:hypothetical protein